MCKIKMRRQVWAIFLKAKAEALHASHTDKPNLKQIETIIRTKYWNEMAQLIAMHGGAEPYLEYIFYQAKHGSMHNEEGAPEEYRTERSHQYAWCH
jgi:hypothetical protein